MKFKSERLPKLRNITIDRDKYKREIAELVETVRLLRDQIALQRKEIRALKRKRG